MERKIDQIIFSFHNKTPVKHAIYNLFYRNLKDPIKKQKAKRKLYFNYKCDADNPRTFNEYLLWIKYYYRNELWNTCADKLKCKEFLKEKGFERNIPKTLGIYKSSKDINLKALPDTFVLKTNHDSGSVYVCNKKVTNFEEIFKKLDESINKKYSSIGFEWFYENIEPLIFAEEYLLPAKGKDLNDYKLFVFNGKYKFGFVASNRSINLRFALFEDDYYFVPCEYAHRKPSKKELPARPENFSEMVKIAEAVGSYFDFARVDLYNTINGIMIGELTFTSMSGFGAFTKKEYDFKYGEYFKETIFYELAHKKDK